MTIEYDKPRNVDDDPIDESVAQLVTQRAAEVVNGMLDDDTAEFPDSFEIPEVDLSGEELIVRVIPRQANEFTCSSCYLVHPLYRIAQETEAGSICSECT
jgi:hypothetical protein